MEGDGRDKGKIKNTGRSVANSYNVHKITRDLLAALLPRIARTFLLKSNNPTISLTMTGIPTRATTPTATKLDLAQHDRPIADDGGGNLSENLVEERFKVLFEDKK